VGRLRIPDSWRIVRDKADGRLLCIQPTAQPSYSRKSRYEVIGNLEAEEDYQEFIKLKKPYVLSLNFIPKDYDIDTAFVSNLKRFSSLDDYDNKYEFLDEVYFALLNYCVDDNILVDCYKALSKVKQEKLLEVLDVIKEENPSKFGAVIDEVKK